MKCLGLASGLILLLAASSVRADDPRPERVFVGYLFGSTRGVDWRLYTHVCHAFVVPSEDGSIRPGRSGPSKDLADEAHKAGVKLLISLGGWGYDRQFAALASMRRSEDRFVKAVIDLVDAADYDGLDFDWEYPDRPDEIDGFERITARFRKDLDAIGKAKARPMFLTMAASANPGTMRLVRKEFVDANFDWLNVMTYDFTGDWTDFAGHHSPLFGSSKDPARRSTESAMRHFVEERKFSPDRLAVGIPLYGRSFGVAEPYASTKGAKKPKVGESNYTTIEKLQAGGWTRRWDDETKNPWLIAPEASAVMGYDDVQSVSLKSEWAMKQGFRGVFFWQIHGDRRDDGSHPLQEAARKVWDAARAEKR